VLNFVLKIAVQSKLGNIHKKIRQIFGFVEGVLSCMQFCYYFRLFLCTCNHLLAWIIVVL